MITEFAQILRELQLREAAVLADQTDIHHAPTIGDMYEGLTRDLLDRAIPPSAGVRIVDGFVFGPDGTLSPQLDCMLVVGEGEAIPYTTHYKWPVQSVLAVFEIKKKLYSAELADSYRKLQRVVASYSSWVENHPDESTAVNIGASFRAFAKLTGRYLRGYEEVQFLPESLEAMFHVVSMEQLSPLRIVIGYDGFVDEYGLREGYISYLEASQNTSGFGVASLPNLVVCGQNSLLKLTGHPYVAPVDSSGQWEIVASNSDNPLRLLLELLWTKLSYVTPMAMPSDDNLQDEALHLFLSAEYKRVEDRTGWLYRYTPINRENLASAEAGSVWSPEEINSQEFSFLSLLAQRGTEDVTAADFVNWAARDSIEIDAFLSRLIERRLIARNGNNVRLVDRELQFSFTPDRRIWAATDLMRLNRWIAQELDRIGEA